MGLAERFSTDRIAHRLFRKRPVTVECVQWTGMNLDDVLDLISTLGEARRIRVQYEDGHLTDSLIIATREGDDVHADRDDWIIKSSKGDLHSCKPDIFETTYEKLT